MKYFFLFIPILAFSNPKIENYQKEINQLKIENSKLEIKIDTLNDTNDKILNTVYWTLGVFLTAYLGFNFVSLFKTNRDNEIKLKEIEVNCLKKVTELANKNLQSFNGRIQSSIGNLKDDFKISLTDFHPDSEVIKDPKNVVHYIVVTKAGSAGRALKTLENYINDIKINDKPLNKDLKYEFIDILKTSYTEEFLKDRVDDLISQLKEL